MEYLQQSRPQHSCTNLGPVHVRRETVYSLIPVKGNKSLPTFTSPKSAIQLQGISCRAYPDAIAPTLNLQILRGKQTL